MSTLTSGTKLGRYEIRSVIGAGGMGEVYRARDEGLNRDVAIKVLPAAFSQDGDRLRRFEQEAQAVGALTHPNILAVYDVGTHGGAPYVVSELLEGETFRELLGSGPLASRRATDFAIQMARGLAAAHEKGIIHRDLKPDNVFVTTDGRVKILDFGLAKLIQPGENGAGQTDIATRRIQTDPGTVMGTVGYMSPEQVRGRAVDHRSDIFSFGAVLYEMLSGQRAFHGDSAVETLNAILKEEPAEITSKNSKMSPALERIVWHCLEKSPERRFQSASDIAFAFEALGQSGSTSTTVISTGSRKTNLERLIWIGVSALLLLTCGLLAWGYFFTPARTSPAVRLALATPDQATLPARVTVSPDGLRVVFVANNPEGKRLLWVRPLSSLTAQPLPGTEDAVSPFWSRDNHFVGYFANGKLFKVDAAGGRPQVLCDAAGNRGGAWNRDGVILFSGLEGLYRVSAQGGAPVLATNVAEREEAHRWPYFLPDGRHFVFLADAATTEDHHIRLGSLDSQDSQILFGAVSPIAYAPPGYLLYVSQGALVAVPFAEDKLKVTGDPTIVAEHIAEVGDNHEFDFSVSENGVLAYQVGNPNSQPVWFDREGKKLGTVGEPANYANISLSPDDRRAAFALLDADGRVADLWLMDLARSSMSRFTFDPAGDGDPVWSPDATKIVFSSNRSGGGPVHLYEKAASGAGDEQLVLQSDAAKFPTSWSRDGRFILFENWELKAKGGVWVFPLFGDRQAKSVLQTTAFDQYQGQFSPDGQFVAYTSNESGRAEIYVQPFPPSGQKWKISSGGGRLPLWRSDGKELFYITDDGKLMSSQVKAGGSFDTSDPQQLFQANAKRREDAYCYAATADGQRFLVNTFVQGNNPAPMTVVLNWTADLKK